jgi:hypothetical protein
MGTDIVIVGASAIGMICASIGVLAALTAPVLKEQVEGAVGVLAGVACLIAANVAI